MVRGTASPKGDTKPFVSNDRVAWIEERGVVTLGIEDPEPVLVSGLGRGVTGVSGADGTLYASCADGAVRAAGIAAPTKTVWQVAVGTAPDGAPLLLDDYAVVLVRGGVVAIAR
jgi:hypothetical protein